MKYQGNDDDRHTRAWQSKTKSNKESKDGNFTQDSQDKTVNIQTNQARQNNAVLKATVKTYNK